MEPTKPILQNSLLFPEILWQRPQHNQKREHGRVFIIAGSVSAPGAGLLAAEAAYRAGAGTVLFGYPQNLKHIYKGIIPDAMGVALDETPGGSLAFSAYDAIMHHAAEADVVAIGSGLSNNQETLQLVQRVITTLDRPLIVDADALEAVARSPHGARSVFQKRTQPTVVMPYASVLGSLMHKPSVKKIDQQKPLAQVYAQEWGVVLLLKGENMVIAEPQGKIVFDQSGSMDIAGAQDVLLGLASTIWAQNPHKAFEATCVAVYVNGQATKQAAEELKGKTVTPSDIINHITTVLTKAEKEL